MRVLLIEDDASIAQSIEMFLTLENFEVTKSACGADGLALAQSARFDLIVLDLGLPDMPGMEVLTKLRATSITTPLMILSGINEIQQKVRCLIAGADDYVTKPFHRNEFLARLRTLVRRCNGTENRTVRVGDLCIDLDSKTVDVAGKPVRLTGKEYELVAFLASRRGFALSKEMILNHLYGGMDEPALKIVDVFICKVRQKIAAISGRTNYIGTVWGRGYMLNNADPSLQMAPSDNDDTIVIDRARSIAIQPRNERCISTKPRARSAINAGVYFRKNQTRRKMTM